MKVRLAASFLAIILFTSTISVFFTSDVVAQSDISVAIKGKKSTLLLAMKNNDDTSVYSVEIKSKEGTIRFVKAKDWDRQKIDASTVMIQTDDKPITKGRTQIIILLMDNPFRGIEWKAFDIQHNLLQSDTAFIDATAKSFPIPSERDKPKEIPKPSCNGTAACFTATVTNIVDGDTIDVNDGANTVRIRLALTNTPERGQPLYNQAVQFTANLCSVGSIAGIDEDDGQREGSYDRMIAKVFCSDKILNAELLYASLAVVDQRFCNESEFANEAWAQQYGCKQTVQQTPPPSVTPTPPPPPPTPPQETEKNCDPSYPTVCIPPPPPDLDCDEIPYKKFKVLPPDPHGFDRDKDGIGCET